MRFTVPRDIYYGRNSLENLKNLSGKKAILAIGGGTMKRTGFLDKALNYLKEAGIETKLIENIEQDPSVETVMKGAKMMQEFEPDWIIAMGGGSPMDAAKAMWIFYEYPELSFEELLALKEFPTLRKKAQFLAIPTTSGTGSEVTSFSIITDYQKGIKFPIADFNITPDIAIVDPELVESMPEKLTAHTGMDALTHAFEAYTSTIHSAFTDSVAVKAVEMVKDYLIKSYNKDMEAREQMHYAQCIAGMAFSNTSLGIVHSMAHKTGAAFSTGHIPHGCANAIYLPYVIQYNARVCADRYADLARIMGLSGTVDELVEKVCERIREMNRMMNIPLTLQEFGVNEEEFKEKVSMISANAVGDACTLTNARTITPEVMEQLLVCTYYGKKVDF